MPGWAFALLAVVVTTAFFLFLLAVNRLALSSATLSIPGLANFTFEASRPERNVAWALYVELRTRKAALPFDPEHDLIVEVYDSLYELFPRIRSLLDSIPPREPDPDLANLVLRVQNDVIRGHLTRWQARFRHWYEHEIAQPSNAGEDPVGLQRRFESYDNLVADMQEMNRLLDSMASSLLEIATPDESAWRRVVRHIPGLARLGERRPKPLAPTGDR
ncbi:MAG: hypothetical protein DK306_000827 [Chloroflexi bacterium]|jgi:hypothetical protein|nr:MAG: hypothetical protein DK306_000827 [Chloroflexota bacterium]